MSVPAGRDAGAGERRDLVGEHLELTVDSVAVGGDGVGREPSGRARNIPRPARRPAHCTL